MAVVRGPSLGVVYFMVLMIGMVTLVGMAAIWDVLFLCGLVLPLHLWPAVLGTYAQVPPSRVLIYCLRRFQLPHRLMVGLPVMHFFVLVVMIVLRKRPPRLSRARKRPT
jgi:hypothetical protein